MTLLSVSVQFYAEPKIISYIKKESFWPKPKVDSAIIKISNIRNLPRIESKVLMRGQKSPKESRLRRDPTGQANIDKDLFFKVVKAGFSQPRKQLANNLANGLKLDKEEVIGWLLNNNISPVRRAETLTINEWKKLTKS